MMPASMHSPDVPNRNFLMGQLELARSFLYTAEVVDDPEVQYRNLDLAERALNFIENLVLKEDPEAPVRKAFEELRARSRSLKS
jgi:hypothetical protein